MLAPQINRGAFGKDSHRPLACQAWFIASKSSLFGESSEAKPRVHGRRLTLRGVIPAWTSRAHERTPHAARRGEARAYASEANATFGSR
jgi:hypothetical protein